MKKKGEGKTVSAPPQSHLDGNPPSMGGEGKMKKKKGKKGKGEGSVSGKLSTYERDLYTGEKRKKRKKRGKTIPLFSTHYSLNLNRNWENTLARGKEKRKKYLRKGGGEKRGRKAIHILLSSNGGSEKGEKKGGGGRGGEKEHRIRLH